MTNRLLLSKKINRKCTTVYTALKNILYNKNKQM